MHQLFVLIVHPNLSIDKVIDKNKILDVFNV